MLIFADLCENSGDAFLYNTGPRNMIVVTGGAGFIGSNLTRALGERVAASVVVVDDLTAGRKFRNLVGSQIADYLDKDQFLALAAQRDTLLKQIECVFHLGACSNSAEWNGRHMMLNNYEYSKQLFHYCIERKIPFVYASSAAVFGASRAFREVPEFEHPLSVYAYSKMLFDHYVRRYLPRAVSPIIGLRYFNVYGPHEAHKGDMASIVFQLYTQVRDSGVARLFKGCDGYRNGEQRRDFVHVDDVVSVNLWFLDHLGPSGIFNVGTGCSHTFRDVAAAIIRLLGRGQIKYVPFPAALRGVYQSFTEADLSALRGAGYNRQFKELKEGVAAYVAWLDSNPEQGVSGYTYDH